MAGEVGFVVGPVGINAKGAISQGELKFDSDGNLTGEGKLLSIGAGGKLISSMEGELAGFKLTGKHGDENSGTVEVLYAEGSSSIGGNGCVSALKIDIDKNGYKSEIGNPNGNAGVSIGNDSGNLFSSNFAIGGKLNVGSLTLQGRMHIDKAAVGIGYAAVGIANAVMNYSKSVMDDIFGDGGE